MYARLSLLEILLSMKEKNKPFLVHSLQKAGNNGVSVLHLRFQVSLFEISCFHPFCVSEKGQN
jgi:hypothetical protein